MEILARASFCDFRRARLAQAEQGAAYFGGCSKPDEFTQSSR